MWERDYLFEDGVLLNVWSGAGCMCWDEGQGGKVCLYI